MSKNNDAVKRAAGLKREEAKRNGTLLLFNKNRVMISKKERSLSRNKKYGAKYMLRQELKEM